jgi:DNA-binding SARP family transcriptional activator
LEIRHDGMPFLLRGVKPRQLLALLALRPNRSVPAEQLTEELWEGEPPASAATALRVHVGRLRQVLEPERDANAPSGRLPAGPYGYLLRVEPDELDAQRFERLVLYGCSASGDGDFGTAAARLTDALDLWHGRAFADIADLSAARAERARLEELRARAFEELVEARLTLGDHALVIDVLRGAIEEFPLHERFTAQLMRALYRCGRQAEALRAYTEHARRLDEALGVEPSATLRSLEEDVLLQRPGLDFVPPRPAVAASAPRRRGAPSRFIDRRVETATLLATLDAVVSGERRLVLIGGQEGIGKTTLLEEFSDRAVTRGVPVVIGRCRPDPVVEYESVVEILHALVDRLDEAGRASLPADLKLLLPDLPAPGAPRPAGGGLGAASERYRLYEAVATLVAAAGAGPLVLVVDDAHWADRPTFAVLRHLVRHRGLVGVMVVVTFRDDEIGGEAAELLDALAPPAATERMHLSGFGHNEVRALLRAVAAPEAVESLVELVPTVQEVTAGNPLFIRELLRSLDEESGRFDDTAELERTITTIAPAGVRALVERRMGRLSERGRDVIHVAAISGMDVSLDLLAPACAFDGDELMDALEECLAARLLVEHGDHLDRFQFPHAMVRNAVYAQIPDSRRVELHRHVGEALETMQHVGRAPAALAHHFVAAASRPDLVPKAARYSAHAGRDAAERFAFAEAARWFEHAIHFGADCCDDVPGLWYGLALAYEGDGQLARARDAYTTAARLARDAGDPALLADVAVAAAGPWSSGFASQAVVLELLDEALDALGDRDLGRRARVLNGLAAALYYVDPDREGRIAEEALELGHQLGDDAALAAGRLALHRWLTHRPEASSERLALSEAVVGLTTGDERSDLHLRACRLHLNDLLENARIDDFDAGLDRYEQVATELRSPHDMYWSAALRATQATLHGDLVAGEQLARGAELRGQELQQAPGAHMLQRFVVRYQQGRLAEMHPTLRKAADEMPAYRAGAALAAVASAETGRADEAARIVHRVLGRDGSRLPRDVFWLAAVALFAGAVADACDTRLHQLLTELLMPCADHVVVFGVGGAVFGTGHHWIGNLATAQGEADLAIEHLSQAVELSERIGAPYWSAQARLDLGRALALRRDRDDDARIRSLTDAAVASAHAGGYGRIPQRADRSRPT